MIKILCIVDYKNKFSTKVPSNPYNSGLDKDILASCFKKLGCKVEYISFAEIDFKNTNYQGQYIIYTSSEDYGLFYKSYIEDIIYGLEDAGAILLPQAKFLRAHHNKVYMEILRDLLLKETGISSKYFGTIVDLIKEKGNFKYPLIMKPFAGASSKGVGLIKNEKELIRHARGISKCNDIKGLLFDWGLYFKKLLQKDPYIRDSFYKKKFLVQNFIPKLSNDWKILIYGNMYYILFRQNRENDFRASGSGLFQANEQQFIPDGIFDYAMNIYNILNVPQLSIDVAFDGERFYLIEFQAISFGTLTQTISEFYFSYKNGKWEKIIEQKSLEQVFAESTINYISKKI